jgi:hypothetical protein
VDPNLRNAGPAPRYQYEFNRVVRVQRPLSASGMLQVVYPDGERLTYGYDGGGSVASASGVRPAQPHGTAGAESYLRSIQYDEFGQRVQVVLGNGVVSRYAYDDIPWS